ncbi:hypothetical protein TNIN_78651 [Trichonephila inaurata madagascariensis]|uniref:Uncharacterized protein n=1 Tax=Trichonephila inaurata madagascariensis TaxID=2747483 RepID=A0A8X7C8U7_9ARAC|nr:hypothetical protein TNIN_78651 [Trichonephila inaurata madagascariensis]
MGEEKSIKRPLEAERRRNSNTGASGKKRFIFHKTERNWRRKIKTRLFETRIDPPQENEFLLRKEKKKRRKEIPIPHLKKKEEKEKGRIRLNKPRGKLPGEKHPASRKGRKKYGIKK